MAQFNGDPGAAGLLIPGTMRDGPFGQSGEAFVIYTFKSDAAGDLIMLGANGDQLLQMLGREPAPKGIFEAHALPSLMQRLEAAVADEAPSAAQAPGADDAVHKPATVALRARVWPMVEMMRLADKAGKPIVWGV